MKFEEALALMREGKKIRAKHWSNDSFHIYIENENVYCANSAHGMHRPMLFEFDLVNCNVDYLLGGKDLFGEWEVYDGIS